MKRKVRRQLKDRYESEIDKAADLLMNNADDSQISLSIKKVEGYSKLLDASKSNQEKLWAIVVALLCIMVAGLLWSRRTSDSKILLNIQSDSLRATITQKWSQQVNFDESKIAPNSQAQIANSEDIKIAGKSCGPSLTLIGNVIQLTRLVLNEKANIELTSEQDNLNLYMSKSKIEGEFTYSNSVQFSDNANQCIDRTSVAKPIQVPENISFIFNGQGATPLTVKVRPLIAWPLRNLNVDSLEFSRENTPGSGEFETSIKKGGITFYDTGAMHELKEGDRLKLEDVKGKCMKIWAENGINATCELTAKNILLGPKGGERNLSPSWLEYLYYKKPLGFLWSTVVFLWGILWGARQLLSTK